MTVTAAVGGPGRLATWLVRVTRGARGVWWLRAPTICYGTREAAEGTEDAALAATAYLALGSALIGAGTARHQEGEIDAAIAVFRHGLDADPGWEHGFLPIMLTHAGRACLLAGDFPAARGHLDQALQIAQTQLTG